MASSAEVDAMRRALLLAAGGGRRTHPNPQVGAVILDHSGRTVGEGCHLGAGHPHAEVEALAAAGERARGGTAVVTLEPCAHTGRTGPCTTALLAAGVSRVVYAQSDPNPLARGGAEVLASSGVAVESGVLATEAEDLNRAWSLAMQRKRPYLVWKVASSIDGRVAAADGSSRWISGSEARRQVHALRAAVDAVVVGTGTVLADDPQLTARTPGGDGTGRQPLRVVVGRRPIDADAKVLDSSAETVRLTSHSPDEVLAALFDREVHVALLEGGPTVAAAYVRAGAVDAAIGYLAPLALGAGTPMLGDLGVDTLADARRFTFADVRLAGDDIRWTARLSDAPLLDLEGDR